MERKKLSNTQMGKLLARAIGEDKLTIKDRKVILTDEQRTIIKSRFGEKFLSNLESSVFADDDSEDDGTNLFDEAVNSIRAEKDAIITGLNTQIKKLQNDITTLTQAAEPTPVTNPVAQNPKVRTFNINKTANYNKAAYAAIQSGDYNVELTSGIDITDIKNEFNTAMPPGARLDMMLKRIYNGFPDSKYMTKRLSKGRNWMGAAAIQSEVSQQFTNKWTPKGTTKFTPISIPYRRHKINVEIDPTEIIDTWLLDLYEQGKTPDQHPLVHYIINNHILPKVAEDITFAMIAKGKFVKATNVKTNDEGTPAAQSMDGFETILVEGKTTGVKFNYIKNAEDIRELTGQDLLDYIDNFCDKISPLFAKNLPIFCSPEVLKAYKRADFQVYGKYTGTEAGNTLRFTKFTLIALDSMYDSPILFATPIQNFIMLVDLSAADRCINDIQKQDYIVKIFGEYSLSVGFAIAEAVFASVPSGYTPSEAVIDGSDAGNAWEHGTTAEAGDTNDEQEGA